LTAECIQIGTVEKRTMNWKSIAWLHASMRTTIFALFMGAGLTIGLTFFESVLAITVGMSVVVVLMSLHGRVGQSTGKSLFEYARYSFGERGSKILISGIMLIMSLGWNGVGLSLVSFAVSALFGIPRTYLIFSVVVVIYGLLVLIPPLLGVEKMAKISWLPFLLTVLLSIYMLYVALMTFSTSEILYYTPTTSFSILYGIDLVIGNSIGYALGVTNFTMKMDCKDNIWYPFIIGFGVPGAFMMIIGIIMAARTHTFDLIQIMIELNLNAVAYLMIIISLYILFGTGIYNTGLALKNTLEGTRYAISERGYMLVSGILGIIAAVSGIFDYIFEWLSVLSIMLPPIIGILLSDYYFIHRKIGLARTPPQINCTTFLIWLSASVVSYFIPQYFARSMISFFLGFFLYYLSSLSSKS